MREVSQTSSTSSTPSDSGLKSKPNTRSPGGWQAFSSSPSIGHLVADGSTTRQFRRFELRSLPSSPWHGNPTDCVRSRQIRIYRESNPDAVIVAFLKSDLVKPAPSLRTGVRRLILDGAPVFEEAVERANRLSKKYAIELWSGSRL